jgi:glycosyltransferase involved in cell wall biosynthesis
MPKPSPSKIVLVSSGQPSLNPRLVKEADTLAENGYDVLVLYAYWNEWGTLLDKAYLPSKAWKAICVAGDPHNKPVIYFISRILHKFSVITAKTGLSFLNEYALARSSFFLVREAKKHIAELYIGHNLGALPAIVKAAKNNNAKCGFDAEDFHRYETSNDNAAFDVKLKTSIEDKYIPQVDYLTASSKQITDAYFRLFPGEQAATLLNVFPVNQYIKQPVLTNKPVVKLFWVSQTIGIKRGLEDVLKALQLLKGYNFELHLLGYHDNETKVFIESHNNSLATVICHKPVAPEFLIEFASAFDIGLALEPGFSFNNDYALSNKIFTYMQAGLAIIASDTTAQKDFLSKHPAIGKIYPKGDHTVLADILLAYFRDRKSLNESCVASRHLAVSTLNWESESEKFLAIVNKTIYNGE